MLVAMVLLGMLTRLTSELLTVGLWYSGDEKRRTQQKQNKTHVMTNNSKRENIRKTLNTLEKTLACHDFAKGVCMCSHILSYDFVFHVKISAIDIT